MLCFFNFDTTDTLTGNMVDFMSIVNDGIFNSISIYIACALIILTVFWIFRSQRKNSPPGPIGIPVLGYLPFLGSEPYRVLHNLKKKYGNVFGLYLGKTYVVFLADYEAVKEGLGKSTTTDRPSTAFDIIPDGVGFSSVNGEDWVEQRRYCVKAMRDLGLGRNVWESLVQAEVEDFVKAIAKHKGEPFDISKILTASIANNIASLIFGKRLPLDDQTVEFLYKSITAIPRVAGQVGLRNSFPFLFRVLSKFGISDYSIYKKHLLDFNQFVRDQVKNHKNEDQSSEDFIDGYLKKMTDKGNNVHNSFNDTNLYGNIQALFIGASDTSKTSLIWLLLAMANYLDIQKKVHEELDSVLGRDGTMQWSERSSVPFTFAVIMEGQRWKTIAPLNTARIAMEDMKLGGFDIQKGTSIVANNWGLHNDTEYWENPDEFLPERFLSTDRKKVNLKPESYVPFSYGKRNCPGETVAMMEILCYFVAILQKFMVLPPEGQVPNLRGTLGLTFQPQPQELRFVHRKSIIE